MNNGTKILGTADPLGMVERQKLRRRPNHPLQDPHSTPSTRAKEREKVKVVKTEMERERVKTEKERVRRVRVRVRSKRLNPTFDLRPPLNLIKFN